MNGISKTLKFSLLTLCLALGSGLASLAYAQTWPAAKQITVLLPLPAGGSVDTLLRATSAVVSRNIGQTIVIENRPGANGVIVGQAVRNTGPDGYVIGLNYASHVINPYLLPNLPYDTFRDFIPVTRLAELALLLVAPSSAPYSTVPELTDFARKNPGKVSYAQPGMGGASHFAFEMLRRSVDLAIEIIPYKGEAPLITDILSSRVGLAQLPAGSAQQHVSAGKLKILGAMTAKRLSSLPNVPTVSEGLPAFNPLPIWYGLYMRAGTPPAIADRLAAEYRTALDDPAVKARLATAGFVSVGSTPGEFSSFLRDESKAYGDLIRQTGFKLEQ